jgi:predicted MPP superfamily phosphohydrolase
VILPLLRLQEQGRRNALDVRLRHEELAFPSLPVPFAGFRLLLMSDLHIDQDPDLPQVVLERLGGLEVDVACLAGDFRRRILGDHRPALELLRPIVQAINAHEGIFAVRGNHDSAQLIAELAALGVHVLDNRAHAVVRQGERLWLGGVDDPHLYRAHDVAVAMKSVPSGEFTILLAHSPEAYAEAARAGVALYLCGHTHGGQVLLPGIGSLVKNMRAPMALHRGFWRYDGMLGFTSTGVGSGSVFARFNCPPEMVLLTLRRGERAMRL